MIKRSSIKRKKYIKKIKFVIRIVRALNLELNISWLSSSPLMILTMKNHRSNLLVTCPTKQSIMMIEQDMFTARRRTQSFIRSQNICNYMLWGLTILNTTQQIIWLDMLLSIIEIHVHRFLPDHCYRCESPRVLVLLLWRWFQRPRTKHILSIPAY
jgi:hypothetical protein